MGNGGTTHSPNINNLIDTGVMLNQYYTFKVVCPAVIRAFFLSKIGCIWVCRAVRADYMYRYLHDSWRATYNKSSATLPRAVVVVAGVLANTRIAAHGTLSMGSWLLRHGR